MITYMKFIARIDGEPNKPVTLAQDGQTLRAPYCAECKYNRDTQCDRPPATRPVDLVTGKQPGVRVPTDCWFERYPKPDEDRRDVCGPSAQYFEPL